MKINKAKVAVATVATGVTATGWGLYGASKANQPEKTLTAEETTPMVTPMPTVYIPPQQPVTLTVGGELGDLIKEQADNYKLQIKQLQDETNYYKQRINNFTTNFEKVFKENLEQKKKITTLSRNLDLYDRNRKSQQDTIKHLLEENEKLYNSGHGK